MFKYVPYVPRESSNSVEALVKGFLLAERLDPWHDKKPHTDRDRLLRKPVYQGLLRGVRDVREVVVLICGHGGRDYRCGVYGPLLRGEFEKRLPERGVQVLKGPVEVEGGAKPAAEGKTDAKKERRGLAARVGLISHVGGHKWAGNLIIYLPPDMKTKDGEIHRLAGHGIWYRRVEPRHVEGLIEETILNGLIVGELFGGGIRPDGEPV
jgi:(2Fe-2S) ferredoxin